MNKNAFLGILLLSAVIGCGERTTPVSGVVTIDGKPAGDLLVLFQADTDAPTIPEAAYGITDAEGRFVLSLSKTKRPGVVPGDYAVMIAWRDPNPPERDDQSNPCPYVIPPEAKEGLLRYTVKAEGKQAADFHLTNDNQKP